MKRAEPRNYSSRAELAQAIADRHLDQTPSRLSYFLFWLIARSPFGFWIIPSDYGPDTEPYLLRAYLTPRWFPIEIFLHFFFRGDAQRDELHNHPWAWALSWIFSGGYVENFLEIEPTEAQWWPAALRCELSFARVRTLYAPCLNLIRSSTYHRVTLSRGDTWSLFLCGPRVRDWGFLGAGGYTPHNLRRLEREGSPFAQSPAIVARSYRSLLNSRAMGLVGATGTINKGGSRLGADGRLRAYGSVPGRDRVDRASECPEPDHNTRNRGDRPA